MSSLKSSPFPNHIVNGLFNRTSITRREWSIYSRKYVLTMPLQSGSGVHYMTAASVRLARHTLQLSPKQRKNQTSCSSSWEALSHAFFANPQTANRFCSVGIANTATSVMVVLSSARFFEDFLHLRIQRKILLSSGLSLTGCWVYQLKYASSS